MEFQTALKQTQSLSPQMMQAMEILQMGAQELRVFLQEAAQENPVLEMDEGYNAGATGEELRQKLEWLEATDPQNRCYHREDAAEEAERAWEPGAAEEESLCRYLLAQLEGLAEGPKARACAFLVQNLDDNGWLREPVEALAEDLGCPEEEMAWALGMVQSLEPAGVGARSLKECLQLQLCRRGEAGLAMDIVDGYLNAMSRNHFSLIARELGVGLQAVREACERIKALNPRPGSGFARRENLRYLDPDVVVVRFQDHFELLTNDYFFPSLRLSGYYQALWKETGDGEVREYLGNKVRQAQWLLRSVEQRRSTLLACAGCILDLQEPFFRLGPGRLAPMTLADVARRMGVHESTVSRAVKDKYLQCSAGVYPMGYFFSRALGPSGGGKEGGTSPDSAKALLKRLVAGEDRRRPLSDQKLCARMAEEGCTLSRRTVAKYRDELHIPSAAGRRAETEGS